MTSARTSVTRIAGCYIDRDGKFGGSFNTNFLKLSGSDRAKNLKLAKTVPFSDTNKNLKKYGFAPKAQNTYENISRCKYLLRYPHKQRDKWA